MVLQNRTWIPRLSGTALDTLVWPVRELLRYSTGI